jgi:hypothetical protein
MDGFLWHDYLRPTCASGPGPGAHMVHVVIPRMTATASAVQIQAAGQSMLRM